jgi:hypothetical protein
MSSAANRLFSQGISELIFRNEAQIHQQFTQFLGMTLLRCQGNFKLRGRDAIISSQNPAKLNSFGCRRGSNGFAICAGRTGRDGGLIPRHKRTSATQEKGMLG